LLSYRILDASGFAGNPLARVDDDLQVLAWQRQRVALLVCGRYFHTRIVKQADHKGSTL
jgi:hypothetical protein